MTIGIATLLAAGSVLTSRVYLGTGGDRIYTAEFDAKKGSLSEIRRAVEAEGPGFIALHPDLPVLYAALRPKDASADGSVGAYRIRADGTLSLLNRQSSWGRGICHVSTDPAGTVVMAAHYHSGSVIACRIRGDGTLSDQYSLHQHEGSGEHHRRQKGPHAHSIFSNPEGTYAYAPDLGIDKIMIYKVGTAADVLMESGFAEVPGGGMGPRHMKWSADGAYAYVLNELDLSLSVFKPGDEPGSLTFVATKPVLPEGTDRERMTSAEVRIHPNGKFIYASIRDLANQGRDAISVFSEYGDGFNLIASVPARVRVPRNFNLDPTGRWLLAGGQESRDLAVFSVNPQTGLIEHKETVAMEQGPICIEFAAAQENNETDVNGVE